VQRIEQRFSFLLANVLPLFSAQLLDLSLNVVDLGEMLQREPGNLTLVGRMQVEEFAPGMRRTLGFRDAICKPGFAATEERLMRRLGLQGALRGKTVRTATPDTSTPCPLDRVNRDFKASRPNELWVSDFTYVSTWQGWLYMAFVVDVYARRIMGWRVSRTMQNRFRAGRFGASPL
jgi:transposase InsO family protein